MSIFGVWVWPQSIRTEGADVAVSRCMRMGVTDIFFLTKGLGGTVSCRSSVAPSCCERDLLRELLDAAHAKGIRVHAWLTSASDEHYKQLHPQSGRFHYTRGRDKALISLADEGYIAYMQRFIRELCSEYDIDGLHLDYIRYNHLLYGWSEEDCARYHQSGADIKFLKDCMDRTFLGGENSDPDCIFNAFRQGDPSVRSLAAARRQDVVHFAKAMIEPAKAARRSLILSAALMPEGAYDDTAFADLHYGQNYDDAASLYDYVLPMAYSKAYEKDSFWVKSVAEGTIKRGLKPIMGLHAYDGGTNLTLSSDIAALLDTPVSGICLFRYGAFALAFSDDHAVHLINTLEKPITAVSCGAESLLDQGGSPLFPGEERRFSLTHAPAALQVFTDNTEACVYLCRSKAT